MLTDRFAKTNTADTAACGNLGNYCGGTWKGMEQKLDYIKNLGFDAIWITPIVESEFPSFYFLHPPPLRTPVFEACNLN